MAFFEEMTRHVEQIRGRLPHVEGNEQATKQALVVPLLQVLGYDVFNPREVRPEYVADFAVKKQGQFEKVDFVIYLDEKPAVFVECKPVGGLLSDHDGQLSRYFNATPEVRVAVITDGVRLRAFTDLRSANVMDPTPWFTIDLLNAKQAEIESLRWFRKSEFVASEIISVAEEMVYYNLMVDFLSGQLKEPSESFVRFVAGEIQAAGRVTGRIVERLSPILRKAIQTTIVEHVARSFDPPSQQPSTPNLTEPVVLSLVSNAKTGKEEPVLRDGVVTTVEEMQIFDTVCSWVREVFPDAKLALRDSKSYATVHQDNIRKWFLRIGVERRPWWIALRNISLDEARRTAPGLELSDAPALGGVKLTLPNLSEFPKARAAVILVYQRELERKLIEDVVDQQEVG